MYQAWCQGNTNSKQDWYFFVQFAARHCGKEAVDVMQELQKYTWFEWVRSE
jgi:hypothetical protein